MLEHLGCLWLQAPDLRLGQLLFVLAGKDDLYNMEDLEMMKRILKEETRDDALHCN